MKIFQAINIAWEWCKGKKTYFFGIMMLLGAIGNIAGAFVHGTLQMSIPWIILHWATVNPYWIALNLAFAVLTGRAAIPTNYQPLSVRVQAVKEKFQSKK